MSLFWPSRLPMPIPRRWLTSVLRKHPPYCFSPDPRNRSRVLQTSALLGYSFSHHSLKNSAALPPLTRQLLRHRPALPTTACHFTMTHSHSHAGHSHQHDNTYLISKNKNDAGVRITRIGLISNLGMAIAKGVGGWAFNSQAMIADGFHSLSDLTSDILTLATLSWSLKPPTVTFPAGFGKVESLGALGVSSMLLGGGLFMCFNSCEVLYAHWMLDAHAAAHVAAHSHGHSHAAMGPSLNAAWLAGGTVIIKEWLYQATMKVAKERKSSVLASNAVHHRVDSLTGIVTLFAILGANFLHDAAWLDPVGGLLISLLVIMAGWRNTMASLLELADKGIDEEVQGSVRRIAEKSIAEFGNSNQVELRDVRGVKSGQNYLVDLEIAVPRMWTIEDAGKIEEAVRSTVGLKCRGVRRVKVRFVPKEDSTITLFDEFVSGDISQRNSPEPGYEHGHGHDCTHAHEDGHGHGHGHDHPSANGNVGVNGDSKKTR